MEITTKNVSVMTDKPFCVYRHNCGGSCFYVGSGTRYRPFVPHGRSPKWIRFVSEHPVYEIEIVKWFDSIEEAKQFEIEEIRKLQPLANSVSKIAKAIAPPRDYGPPQIKHCKMCGQPWCCRGSGRPIRCGKCKSPYWERGRVNGAKPSVVRSGKGGGKKRGRNDASVPVLPGAQGGAVELHSVQSVWDKLAARGKPSPKLPES
jgi:hypothetical protein